jgi:hypothetical protein
MVHGSWISTGKIGEKRKEGWKADETSDLDKKEAGEGRTETRNSFG